MGSWSDLKIDGFSLHGSKSYVDDTTLSIFHERDRRVRTDLKRIAKSAEDGPQYLYEYAIPAQAMRERLDALGFTAVRARESYASGHTEELASTREFGTGTEIARLELRTYEHWCAAIGRLLPQGFQTYDDEQRWSHDPDASDIRNNGEWGLGAFFSDLRFLVRGVLDAWPTAAEMILDYTHLVGWWLLFEGRGNLYQRTSEVGEEPTRLRPYCPSHRRSLGRARRVGRSRGDGAASGGPFQFPGL